MDCDNWNDPYGNHDVRYPAIFSTTIQCYEESAERQTVRIKFPKAQPGIVPSSIPSKVFFIHSSIYSQTSFLRTAWYPLK